MIVQFSNDDRRTWSLLEVSDHSTIANELRKADEWTDGIGNHYRREAS